MFDEGSPIAGDGVGSYAPWKRIYGNVILLEDLRLSESTVWGLAVNISPPLDAVLVMHKHGWETAGVVKESGWPLFTHPQHGSTAPTPQEVVDKFDYKRGFVKVV